MVDIDDTIIEVHGYAKQGSGYGYSGVRGLNALLATVTTASRAPVIVAQRLRKGSCGSPRGAARLVADALKPPRQLRRRSRPAAAGAGRLGVLRPRHRRRRAPRRRRRLGHRAAGPQGQGRDRHHRRRCVDPDRVHRRRLRRAAPTRWISRAEVAEIAFTAFTSQKKAEQVTGRLVVRRIPDLNPTPRTGRTRCSTPGGSTRSSPPPTPTCSTPSPRTRPTAATRSSSRSTPT